MDIKFNTFKKYKLNHEDRPDGKLSIPDALGLSDEFSDQVIKTMRIAEIEKDTHTESWEDTLNKILPQNALEAFYIGWVACKLLNQRKEGDNPFLEILKQMRDR